ncbi:MAG: hypothetical protein KTR14_03805 [Vampirovibrio sp.]|nr:hypothetical protein [Vampirovibrio sp.]
MSVTTPFMHRPFISLGQSAGALFPHTMHSQFPQQTAFDINQLFSRNRQVLNPTQNVNVNQHHIDNVHQIHPFHFNVQRNLTQNNFHSFPTSVTNQGITGFRQNNFGSFQMPQFSPLPGFQPVSGGHGGVFGGGLFGGNSIVHRHGSLGFHNHQSPFTFGGGVQGMSPNLGGFSQGHIPGVFAW